MITYIIIKLIVKSWILIRKLSPMLTRYTLNLLKEHPTYPASLDLVFYYVEAVHPPWPACSISLDAPSFGVGQDTLLWTSISHIFREYGPKNALLLHSLLSDFSLKYNLLTVSSEMYGSVEDGLKATCCSKESQVLVVGTSMQLLLQGFGLTIDLANESQERLPRN